MMPAVTVMANSPCVTTVPSFMVSTLMTQIKEKGKKLIKKIINTF